MAIIKSFTSTSNAWENQKIEFKFPINSIMNILLYFYNSIIYIPFFSILGRNFVSKTIFNYIKVVVRPQIDCINAAADGQDYHKRLAPSSLLGSSRGIRRKLSAEYGFTLGRSADEQRSNLLG